MLQSLFPRPASARAASRTLRCLNVSKQRRSYALQANDATDLKLHSIDGTQLSITQSTTPKDLTPNDELVFGRYFTGTIYSSVLA